MKTERSTQGRRDAGESRGGKKLKVFVTGTRGIPGVMGGVETHCEELMPRLAARGAEVTVARRAGYALDGRTVWKGVGLVDIWTPKSKAFEAMIHTWRAVRMAAKRGVDMVHIHAVGPGLAVPLAKRLGLKVVFTHHGFDYEREKWGWMARAMLRLGERWAVRGADEVIVISRGIEEAMRRKHKRTDCHVIPNGAPPPRGLEAARAAEILGGLGLEAGKYFLAACRFVPEKRLDDLVAAYEGAGCRETKLVLAGSADFEDGYAKRLRARAREAGAVMPGYARGEELEALWTGAKAFFLPSSHEGLPVALLEAMSHGVPSWASDIAANREVGLEESRYFRLGDVEFLKIMMRELDGKGMERVRYEMGKYDWERIADATMEVYRGAAERGRTEKRGD